MTLRKWGKHQITNVEEFIRWVKPIRIIAFDTETTGLHIIEDKPFVITLACEWEGGYYAFSYDMTKNSRIDNQRLIQAIYDATRNGLLIGHNIVFDLHMLTNIYKVVDHNNVMDTQTLIRLGTDAVPEKRGGAPLKLKQFAKKYIDSNATIYESEIGRLRTRVAQDLNAQFFSQFKGQKKKIEDILNEGPNDVDDLPEPYKSAYNKWYNSLPRLIRRNMTEPLLNKDFIPYDMIDRKTLLTYAIYDAIFTYEAYMMLRPLVTTRGNDKILEAECKLILPILRMTRVGFYMNKPYIEETKQNLKAYIVERKQELRHLAGMNITESQNKVILALIQTRFGHPEVNSTGEDVLDLLVSKLKTTNKNDPIIPFISVILELRTLSKWYKTYLIRFHNMMDMHDRVYTSINPAGAVTGRVSSDFQQFPKKAIKKANGEVLFHPRKMVMLGPDEDYLVYIDYSQVELRIQAMYTILIEHPDTNLCRAYMPYLCHHYRTGVKFDPTKYEHIKNWGRKQADGTTSVWLHDEDDKPWESVDLHSLTAINFLKTIGADIPDQESKEFKEYRNKGKTTNFACNYGASKNRIHEMYPDMTMEEATALHGAYGLSFPGVKQYQRYCFNLINREGVGTNLYGRRYYGMSGHNYANAAVQGTGADLLKEKIVELDAFIQENNYRTRIQMNIHDEISFIVPKEEVFIIPQLQHIMQDLPGTLVPIVAEIEVSRGTWADKTKGFTLHENEITFNE